MYKMIFQDAAHKELWSIKDTAFHDPDEPNSFLQIHFALVSFGYASDQDILPKEASDWKFLHLEDRSFSREEILEAIQESLVHDPGSRELYSRALPELTG